MSYRVCILAFPADPVSHEDAMGHLRSIFSDLKFDVDFDEVFVTTWSDDDVERTGLRMYYVCATGRPPDASIDRAMPISRLEETPHAFLGHNDAEGEHVFEGFDGERWLALCSIGPNLKGDVDGLQVDYPQKGYTTEALAALNKKEEEDLTDAEFAAIAEYKSAIDIGLAELFGSDAGRDYLNTVHEEKATQIHPFQAEDMEIPRGAVGAFAYWPTSRFDEPEPTDEDLGATEPSVQRTHTPPPRKTAFAKVDAPTFGAFEKPPGEPDPRTVNLIAFVLALVIIAGVTAFVFATM